MTYFYGHLFAAEPGIGAMFPVAMGEQRQRFFRALTAGLAPGADDSGRDDYLTALGRSHRKYGVREEHFAAFRSALLATCHEFALAPEAESALLAVFDHAAEVMSAACGEPGTPAWWVAEVTRHELLAPDIAVLTLRTDEPMRYLPGQHVSVQTPLWPRLWRRYSIGCAPRPDATLLLHVRAVPGGLVSTALVHRTKPGDTLLLGTPEGTMTANLDSGRNVLCLAGGTGLSPLMAITEALIKAGSSRPKGKAGRRDIMLYHGARTARGLYGLPALRRMAARYPRLTVIPATSGDKVPGALHGTVAELAVRAWWRDRDIYISGPDAMITATTRALLDAGAPPELIRYDLPTML